MYRYGRGNAAAAAAAVGSAGILPAIGLAGVLREVGVEERLSRRVCTSAKCIFRVVQHFDPARCVERSPAADVCLSSRLL